MRRKGITGNGEKMDVRRWKNSKVHIIHLLLPNKYFEELGLIDITTYDVGVLSSFYAGWYEFQEPYTENVRTVLWEQRKQEITPVF